MSWIGPPLEMVVILYRPSVGIYIGPLYLERKSACGRCNGWQTVGPTTLSITLTVGQWWADFYFVVIS